MKTKSKKAVKLKRSEKELLQRIALKLKDRVLFPEKIEDAKRHLQQLRDAES